MYRIVFTVDVVVTEVMYDAGGGFISGALTSANALTDYSYINARGGNAMHYAASVSLLPDWTGSY